jgi:hypothetical protein
MSTLSEIWVHLRMDLLSRRLGRLVIPVVERYFHRELRPMCALKCDFRVDTSGCTLGTDACCSEQAVGGRMDWGRFTVWSSKRVLLYLKRPVN